MSILEKRNLLEKMREKDSYENFVFKKVEKLKWFSIFKEEGYFSPDKCPEPQETDKKGYFIIPEWKVLPYLERISEKISKGVGVKYVDDLLEIISSVSSYYVKNKSRTGNYRTWWYFVKILVNLPNEKIPVEVLNYIPMWIETKFNSTLQGSEIVDKLLPKFLIKNATKEDIEKAELIFSYVIGIKWKRKSDVFKNGKEAETLIDGYWLHDSFIKNENAKKLARICSEKSIFVLADQLVKIFQEKSKSSRFEIEQQKETFQLIICETYSNNFKLTIKVFDSEKLKKERVKNDWIVSPDFKAKRELSGPEFNASSKDEFRVKFKKSIDQFRITKTMKDKFIVEGQNLFKTIFSDYSYIWFRAMKSDPDVNLHGAKEVLTLILREILIEKAKGQKAVVKKIIAEFLSDRYLYPFFTRLVLYVVSENWSDCKRFFWKLVDRDDALFDNSNYESEVYSLTKKNINKFNIREKKKLKDIIEKGPQSYLPDKNVEKYRAYWKQKWYSSIKSDRYFSRLYEEQKKTTKVKEEVGFKKSKVRTGPGPSPLDKDILIRMTNEEIASYFSVFKTKDFWRGPTTDALADMFNLCVVDNPSKFIENLDPFINSDYLYIYNLIRGASDAWSKKRAVFNVEKLFIFVEKYINRDIFWKDKLKKVNHSHWNANHLWVVGAIGELISTGARSEEWSFVKDDLIASKKVLLILINNLKNKSGAKIKDPVGHALNSAYGKVITALILLARRLAFINKQDKQKVKWEKDIKRGFERALKDNAVEAYVLFGQYMAILYFLDKHWVKNKINSFLTLKDERLWKVFVEGYLFMPRVYDEFYVLMRRHYEKLLDSKFNKARIKERLVDHIAIGYLRGYEALKTDVSLFGKLHSKWKLEDINEIISFFWMQRDYVLSKNSNVAENKKRQVMKDRILSFWRYLFRKYKHKKILSSKDKKILSNVVRLAVYFPKINKEFFDWLMISAIHVEENFNSPYFIECLDKLKDKSAESKKFVAIIFYKMMDKVIPSFDKNHTLSIIEFLYEEGNADTREIVNSICNRYKEKGYDFLDELHDRFNVS